MSNQDVADIVGYIGAVNISIVQIPQFWKTYQSKNADGLSLAMIVLNIFGGMMWLIYGILLNLPPIYGANVMFLSVNVGLLFLKLQYRNNPPETKSLSSADSLGNLADLGSSDGGSSCGGCGSVGSVDSNDSNGSIDSIDDIDSSSSNHNPVGNYVASESGGLHTIKIH